MNLISTYNADPPLPVPFHCVCVCVCVCVYTYISHFNAALHIFSRHLFDYEYVLSVDLSRKLTRWKSHDVCSFPVISIPCQGSSTAARS